MCRCAAISRCRAGSFRLLGAEIAGRPIRAKNTKERTVARRERAATGLLLIITQNVSIRPAASIIVSPLSHNLPRRIWVKRLNRVGRFGSVVAQVLFVDDS